MIKTIKNDASAELIVKKSKFISNIMYVETEEQAQKKLREIQKKYHDAKHNCYAYIIQEINGESVNHIQKSSDNGEPSGTAGAPLLDVLKKQEISNAIIVVTRYFGGILLGTGGLVKAYTESALLAIEKAGVVQKEIGNEYEIVLNYEDINNFNYICNTMNIDVIETKYKEDVNVIIKTTEKEFQKLLNSNIKIKKYYTNATDMWI